MRWKPLLLFTIAVVAIMVALVVWSVKDERQHSAECESRASEYYMGRDIRPCLRKDAVLQ
jgi:hypothetical protein